MYLLFCLRQCPYNSISKIYWYRKTFSNDNNYQMKKKLFPCTLTNTFYKLEMLTVDEKQQIKSTYIVKNVKLFSAQLIDCLYPENRWSLLIFRTDVKGKGHLFELRRNSGCQWHTKLRFKVIFLLQIQFLVDVQTHLRCDLCRNNYHLQVPWTLLNL